jgi:hypothetical protein
MSLDDARKCFAKNLDVFSDPNLHSEKYHLYMGLVALTDALGTIFDELLDIDEEHIRIKTQMSTIQRRLAKLGKEGR